MKMTVTFEVTQYMMNAMAAQMLDDFLFEAIQHQNTLLGNEDIYAQLDAETMERLLGAGVRNLTKSAVRYNIRKKLEINGNYWFDIYECKPLGIPAERVLDAAHDWVARAFRKELTA